MISSRLRKLWSYCFRIQMLLWWTLLGVIVGSVIGLSLHNAHLSDQAIELIGYVGELFIRALRELVLPLIVFALMTGVFSVRHANSGIGNLLRWSLSYYMCSMLLAVCLGLSLVSIIKPGSSAPFKVGNASGSRCQRQNSTLLTMPSNSETTSVVESFLDIGRKLIPTNIVAAASEPNYLGVISFCIVFALAATTLGEQAHPFIHLVELCNAVLLKIIFAVIVLTPIGVASLTASTILKACDIQRLLKSLGLYMVTVLGGLLIHSFITLPVLVFVFARINLYKALKNFLPALFMGLGTASSAATMPVTMQCAETQGCDESIVRFVIPLGTNINRDGTALYEAMSVLYICQAHGLSLPISKLFVLAIIATLAAVGSAPIPNAALVTMVAAMQAIGYPQFIGDVSILYAMDWLLGAVRTSVNIWGDSCACMVVDAWARSLRSRNVLPASGVNIHPLMNEPSIQN